MKKESVVFTNPRVHCKTVTMEIDENTWLLGEHFHNEIEMVFVEKGQLMCNLRDKKIIVKENEILFINKHVIHSLSYLNTVSKFTYLQIDIDPYADACFKKEYLYFCPHTKEAGVEGKNSSVFHVFSEIENEIKNTACGNEIYIRGSIYQLVAIMLREGFLAMPNEPRLEAALEKIMPALEFTEKNFQTKIELDTVSEFCKMDRFNFCKSFKKATGTTFVSYLNDRRIKYAEVLLMNTADTITEIAFACGFASLQYFNRIFYKYRGLSPSSYRKMLIK